MTIQSLEGGLAQTALPPYGGAAESAAFEQGTGPGVSSDAISLSPAQTTAGSSLDQASMLSPLSGLLSQLMQMLQSLMGGASTGLANLGGGGGQCSPYAGKSGNRCLTNGNEQYFASAQGSDGGDPHLSFNGSKWNSMVSHPNLLQSNSIPGGYRVSTQVGSPNERGVTRNQSAQVTLDGGRTTVGLNGDGQASIVRNGESIPISAGQTVKLGNGTSVTCKQNGSLCVDSRNTMGGQISTTLSTKNGGVDVAVNAQNVDLGGALVRGEPGSNGPSPSPIPSPIPSPVTSPTSTNSGGEFVQPPMLAPPFSINDPGSYAQPAYQEPVTQYDAQ